MAVEGYIGSKALARELGISVTAVNRLALRGTLPSLWIDGKRVWPRETIRRYLLDSTAQGRRRSPALSVQRGGQAVAVADVAVDAIAARSGEK